MSGRSCISVCLAVSGRSCISVCCLAVSGRSLARGVFLITWDLGIFCRSAWMLSLWLVGSVLAAHLLSFAPACGILIARPGREPSSLHCQVILGPPGKSPRPLF